MKSQRVLSEGLSKQVTLSWDYVKLELSNELYPWLASSELAKTSTALSQCMRLSIFQSSIKLIVSSSFSCPRRRGCNFPWAPGSPDISLSQQLLQIAPKMSTWSPSISFLVHLIHAISHLEKSVLVFWVRISLFLSSAFEKAWRGCQC